MPAQHQNTEQNTSGTSKNNDQQSSPEPVLSADLLAIRRAGQRKMSDPDIQQHLFNWRKEKQQTAMDRSASSSMTLVDESIGTSSKSMGHGRPDVVIGHPDEDGC
ncbi:hypothetical protein IAU59_001407 [Kwoniella sp. CBS 9459]